MILYTKLFALIKEKGHAPTNWLRLNGIHAATVNKMRKNQTITTETIDRLCRLLDCQPGNLMEYVPDEDLTPAVNQADAAADDQGD